MGEKKKLVIIGNEALKLLLITKYCYRFKIFIFLIFNKIFCFSILFYIIFCFLLVSRFLI